MPILGLFNNHGNPNPQGHPQLTSKEQTIKSHLSHGYIKHSSLWPSPLYEWAMNTTSIVANGAIEENPQEEEEEEEGGRARCEWDFTLSTVVSPATTREVSDTVSTIEFDPTDTVLATGGIARKIRIYTLATLLPADGQRPVLADNSAACDFYICTPAKLSSLRWRPDSGGHVIGSGDYDGVVTEYDVDRRVAVFERDEHGGRRVWSVDYSRWAPHVGASGSDDGTVQIWDTRCDSGTCAAVARPGAAVCGVEFDPAGGPAMGVGSADRRAYIYDVRKVAGGPVAVFNGHRRTVTYVRFVGGGRVVTSATDGCHRLWEAVDGREVREYRGHVNGRSFVGLSVWRGGGLLGCGSESNEVFVYDLRWGDPVWVRGFGSPEDGGGGGGGGFVSAVCWRQEGGCDECTLVAGDSNGVLQVFSGKRKPLLW